MSARIALEPQPWERCDGEHRLIRPDGKGAFDPRSLPFVGDDLRWERRGHQRPALSDPTVHAALSAMKIAAAIAKHKEYTEKVPLDPFLQEVIAELEAYLEVPHER